MLACFFVLLIVFMATGGREYAFLMACLGFLILTQLIGIRLLTVLILSGGCLLVGVITAAVSGVKSGQIVLEVLFMVACAPFEEFGLLQHLLSHAK